MSAARDFLQLRYEVDPEELQRIPARGRLLVVANHPSGALDALALLDCIGRVRRDACIVANDLLSLVEPLGELMLPVRILLSAAPRSSLNAGGCTGGPVPARGPGHRRRWASIRTWIP